MFATFRDAPLGSKTNEPRPNFALSFQDTVEPGTHSFRASFAMAIKTTIASMQAASRALESEDVRDVKRLQAWVTGSTVHTGIVKTPCGALPSEEVFIYGNDVWDQDVLNAFSGRT